MRIAVFPGAFPALSETFIVRQITGLIDLGHRIDIYAERRAPKLTREVLDPAEYAYQAESLSALYRLSGLSAYGMKGRYSVLHMHFGPVANSFRFAKELWRAPLVVSFHGYDFSSWPRKHGA